MERNIPKDKIEDREKKRVAENVEGLHSRWLNANSSYC